MIEDSAPTKAHAAGLTLANSQRVDQRIEEFNRYVELMDSGIKRIMTLVRAAKTFPSDASGDILRAAVVLTHAHLEDFLRTVASVFLPMADEQTLNKVPLIGLNNLRSEKFFLGKLAQHKGKTVEDLIRESVTDYLARTNFNSATEVMSFIEGLGLKLAEERLEMRTKKRIETRGVLILIDEMIARRHQIVHCADRAGEGLTPIAEDDVLRWIFAVGNFTALVAIAAFKKRGQPERDYRGLVKGLTEASGPANDPKCP
jgi:hypothetical protein